ncbi:MAG: hypothetical protein Kow0069_23220 [Promethearchaeota archaeon]
MAPNFDEDVLKGIVKDVAFPRLVGTPGEKKVLDYLKKALGNRGFSDVESHQFTFSRFFAGTMVQLVCLGLTFFTLTTTLVLLFSPVMNLVTIGSLVAVAAYVLNKIKDPLSIEAQPATTENLLARVPAKGNSKGTIVVSAHHDSKGQAYVTTWRVGLFVVGILAGTVTLLVALVSALLAAGGLTPSELVPAMYVGGVSGPVATACFFVLTFNNVRNNSAGALDDGTGVAIVLELARALKEAGGLENHDVVFALFSAEEYGLMGSRAFLRDHQFDPKTSYCLNFDMVTTPVQYIGHAGLTRRPVNVKLGGVLERVAAELGGEVGKFWLPVAASTDAFTFIRAGWECLDFVTRRAAKLAHSYSDDTMEAVDAAALKLACELAWRVMKEVDAGKA